MTLGKCTLDKRYGDAVEQIRRDELALAEATLAASLDEAPRAAQTVYLLGVVVLLRGRYEEASRLLDRAYRLKPWIKDLSPTIADLRPHARAALQRQPEWSWAHYELGRRAFFSVGLTVTNVVRFALARPEVFFVQIGANRGDSGRDPIYHHAIRYQWAGIAVEPAPEPFAELTKAYANAAERVYLANVAINDEDGMRTLYTDPAGDSTLASFVPSRNALSRAPEPLNAVDVPCVTFDTLFQRYGVDHIDLLQIDTEGFDYQILKQFDANRYRPLLINMEFYCLSLDERVRTFSLLRESGYAYRFDGMDLVAVDRARAAEEFCIVNRTMTTDSC